MQASPHRQRQRRCAAPVDCGSLLPLSSASLLANRRTNYPSSCPIPKSRSRLRTEQRQQAAAVQSLWPPFRESLKVILGTVLLSGLCKLMVDLGRDEQNEPLMGVLSRCQAPDAFSHLIPSAQKCPSRGCVLDHGGLLHPYAYYTLNRLPDN